MNPWGPATAPAPTPTDITGTDPPSGAAGACRWLKAEYGGVAMVPTDE